MVNLERFYKNYPHFWITSAGIQSQYHQKGKAMYVINMAHFKRPWTYVIQLPRLIPIFIKERPTHLISTGSGRIVLLPYLLSLLFRAKFVHIETFSYVYRLTKMGGFLKKMGCPIFKQWKASPLDGTTYIGPVFEKSAAEEDLIDREDLIFVSLGTRDEPFLRLIQAAEALRNERFVRDRIVVQRGHTPFTSDTVELIDFASPRTIDLLIKRARVVITQESAGLVTKCLRYQTRIIGCRENTEGRTACEKRHERGSPHEAAEAWLHIRRA